MSKRQHAIYLGIIGALALVIVSLITPRSVDDATFAASKRIVVFPFVSTDSRVDALAEELTESLVDYLENTPGIEVVPVSDLPSDMRSSDKHHLWTKDGSIFLGVEGAVYRRGDLISATVQILDGSHDGHVWAKSIDTDGSDIGNILDPVEEQILARVNR